MRIALSVQSRPFEYAECGLRGRRGRVLGGRAFTPPELLKTVPQGCAMLLEPVLHHLRTVPNESQMRVDLLHHRPRAVAELAAHGKGAHGCPGVERLQPRCAVRVAEHAAPNLSL